jgi:hypothetical protein
MAGVGAGCDCPACGGGAAGGGATAACGAFCANAGIVNRQKTANKLAAARQCWILFIES